MNPPPPSPTAVERIGAFSRTLHIAAFWGIVLFGPVVVGAWVYSGADRADLLEQWAEGKANAARIADALDRIKAAHEGSIPESAYDTRRPVDWDGLGLRIATFNGEAFTPVDYEVVITSRERGRYIVSVGPSRIDGTLDAVFTLDRIATAAAARRDRERSVKRSPVRSAGRRRRASARQ